MSTTRYKPAQRKDLAPIDKAGNIYYIRLNTEIGVVYKLGFTSLSSAEDRLAFQGNGHEKCIDSVLCFAFLEDAWDVEQTLHKYFSKKALFRGNDDQMPFFGNGQSELYREDILNLDPDFCEAQAEETRIKILTAKFKSYGATDDQVDKLINNEKANYKNDWVNQLKATEKTTLSPIAYFIGLLLIKPIIFIFYYFFRIIEFVFSPNEIESKKRIDFLLARIESSDGDRRDSERIKRQAKLNKMLKEHDAKSKS
jgi:hypothetical protein